MPNQLVTKVHQNSPSLNNVQARNSLDLSSLTNLPSSELNPDFKSGTTGGTFADLVTNFCSVFANFHHIFSSKKRNWFFCDFLYNWPFQYSTVWTCWYLNLTGTSAIWGVGKILIFDIQGGTFNQQVTTQIQGGGTAVQAMILFIVFNWQNPLRMPFCTTRPPLHKLSETCQRAKN